MISWAEPVLRRNYSTDLPDAIIDWQLFTPADLERRVYLTNGNIRHVDLIASQMLAQRPNRQLSGYRTPIEGLYLCGAGTHPGGEVTGAPGHNAAAAILRDFPKNTYTSPQVNSTNNVVLVLDLKRRSEA